MKKFIILLGMLLLTGNALLAQKLIIGVKAPDLKIKEWITERSLTNGRPTLIEFFFSRSQPSCSRLAVMDTLARKYGDSLNVIPTTKLFPPTEQNSYRSAYCSTTRTECFGSEILRNSERKSCKTRY